LEKVVYDDVDSSTFLGMIDASKLSEGINALFNAFSQYNSNQQQIPLQMINEEEEAIQLRDTRSANDFPALCKHQIPLLPSQLHAVMRDIVSVSEKAVNANLLTFHLYNQQVCSLIHVPSSKNSYRFNRNAKDTGWVKAALLASVSGVEDREEEAAQYLLKYLCNKCNDAFVHVASEAGLLLTNKEMDAASAAAMW